MKDDWVYTLFNMHFVTTTKWANNDLFRWILWMYERYSFELHLDFSNPFFCAFSYEEGFFSDSRYMHILRINAYIHLCYFSFSFVNKRGCIELVFKRMKIECTTLDSCLKSTKNSDGNKWNRLDWCHRSFLIICIKTVLYPIHAHTMYRWIFNGSSQLKNELQMNLCAGQGTPMHTQCVWWMQWHLL